MPNLLDQKKPRSLTTNQLAQCAVSLECWFINTSLFENEEMIVAANAINAIA